MDCITRSVGLCSLYCICIVVPWSRILKSNKLNFIVEVFLLHHEVVELMSYITTPWRNMMQEYGIGITGILMRDNIKCIII